MKPVKIVKIFVGIAIVVLIGIAFYNLGPFIVSLHG